jgi:hypothetical protein
MSRTGTPPNRWPFAPSPTASEKVGIDAVRFAFENWLRFGERGVDRRFDRRLPLARAENVYSHSPIGARLMTGLAPKHNLAEDSRAELRF